MIRNLVEPPEATIRIDRHLAEADVRAVSGLGAAPFGAPTAGDGENDIAITVPDGGVEPPPPEGEGFCSSRSTRKRT